MPQEAAMIKWFKKVGGYIATSIDWCREIRDILRGRPCDDYRDLPRHEHPYFNQ